MKKQQRNINVQKRKMAACAYYRLDVCHYSYNLWRYRRFFCTQKSEIQERKVYFMHNENYTKGKDVTKLGTLEEATARYRLGATTVRKVAKELGALYKIGRVVRVDIPKMDAGIEQMQ